MNYIKQLNIYGFKRISKLNILLKQLDVMIGINGVGKTSLLEALYCIQASAEKRLADQLSRLGGYLHVVSYDSEDKELRIVLDCLLAGDVLAYEQSFTASGVAYSWDTELVNWITSPHQATDIIFFREGDQAYSLDAREGKRSGTIRIPAESALSQYPFLGNLKLAGLAELLSSIGYFHSICIEPGSPIRTPQPIKPTALPGVNGEDLISCLFNIRVSDRSRFELVEDTLRTAFPSFEYIDFPPVAAGTLSMLWKDKQFTQPLYPHQLSEGMLRFLWLTALLYSPELPAITLIDEPEVSLHPRMLSLLAEMLREASQRAQIIVATQSEALVRFMQPEEVLVMDLDEAGHTTATWANEMELGDWLEDYTLDKLWRIGRLEEH